MQYNFALVSYHSLGRQLLFLNVCSAIFDHKSTTQTKHNASSHYLFSVKSTDFTIKISLLEICFTQKLSDKTCPSHGWTFQCFKILLSQLRTDQTQYDPLLCSWILIELLLQTRCTSLHNPVPKYLLSEQPAQFKNTLTIGQLYITKHCKTLVHYCQ